MYTQKTSDKNTKAEILAELGETVQLLNSEESSNEDSELLLKYQELTEKLAAIESLNKDAQAITVVIPFLAGDNETELIYLIRSIQKNFGGHKIAIVGAVPSVKLEVILIEHEAKTANAQLNLVHAIQAACLSDLVTDKFIVAPLDTYFVSPVTLGDLEILKTSKRRLNGVEEEQAHLNTVRLLAEKEMNSELNYACRLPFVIEKYKFVELFVVFPEIESIPVFIETIYNAMHYSEYSALELDFRRDNIQLNAISKEPSVDAFQNAIENKKFLSVWQSAKGSFIDNFLNVKFENKSSVELE